jgi:uncharacterized membrane protein YhiD involved in acid resistance
MLDQYLSSNGYFEFPSFSVAIFTILLAMVLSTIIALTYKFTFQEENFPNKFFQAIVLSSTVSAMVMMAVGDNLAVGFGVLGAVSIIRFRTLIRSPRNIIFIFMSLSVGIATGVFGYAIAISGTGLFCIAVALLYYSPFGRSGNQKIELAVTSASREAIENLLNLLAKEEIGAAILRIRMQEDGQTRYSINVSLPPETDPQAFYDSLRLIEGLSDIRYDARDNDEQL